MGMLLALRNYLMSCDRVLHPKTVMRARLPPCRNMAGEHTAGSGCLWRDINHLPAKDTGT